MGKEDKKDKKEKKAKKSSKEEKYSDEKKHSKKDKKHDKSDKDEKHGNNDKTVENPISSDDFFLKNEEFRVWLRLEKQKLVVTRFFTSVFLYFFIVLLSCLTVFNLYINL